MNANAGAGETKGPCLALIPRSREQGENVARALDSSLLHSNPWDTAKSSTSD